MSLSLLQRRLLHEAEKYTNLGYTVGLTTQKTLFQSYSSDSCVREGDWDGISFVMNGLVCVDFDCPFKDLGWGRDLPPTLKEKSPRGYHLFYRLPPHYSGNLEPKLKWQPEVDLLVKGTKKKSSRYGKSSGPNSVWGEHVLVSPSQGYSRIYPDVALPLSKLTLTPDWILEELGKEVPVVKVTSSKQKYDLNDLNSLF